MKSCEELKSKMDVIHQQMVGAKKNERNNELKNVKCFYKEYDFINGMLRDSQAEDRKKS